MRSGNYLQATQGLVRPLLRKPALANFGFTLVELLVVMSILALLLSLAMPKYFVSVDRAKEKALKQELHTVRKAIDEYVADQGQYPETLQDLVSKKYLNKPPYDPITESADMWIITSSEGSERGAVADLHSGSNAVANDGTPYASW